MLGPFLARFFECVGKGERGAFTLLARARVEFSQPIPPPPPPLHPTPHTPSPLSLPSSRTGLGFVLPAYLCAKVLAAGGPAEDIRRWATYWTVLAGFTSLEWAVLDRVVWWVPLYPELKVAFIVWLGRGGAGVVWRGLAAPALHSHGPAIDAAACAVREGLASAAATRLGGLGSALRAGAAGAVGRLQAVQAQAAAASAAAGKR